MRACSQEQVNLKADPSPVRILRIIALVPTFALFYLLAGAIPSAAIYLQPWAMAYEAVALVSYFLLIVTYAVPDPLLRERFFERLQAPKGGKGSLKLYHVSSVPFKIQVGNS